MTRFAAALFGSQATDALNAGQQGNEEALRRMALDVVSGMNAKEIGRIMGRARAPQAGGGFNWGNALNAASGIASSFLDGRNRAASFNTEPDFGIKPLTGVANYSSAFR